MFKTIGKYVPPAPVVKSPALWGTKAHLDALFGAKATVEATSKHFVLRYKSPAHWLDIFRSYYGPVLKAFAAVDANTQESLAADMRVLLDRFNTATDGTVVIPSEYLEVVAIKRG